MPPCCITVEYLANLMQYYAFIKILPCKAEQ